MSTAEKVAEKYFDDAIQIAPIEVASAFTLGTCLIAGPVSESAWIHWLTQDFRSSWYFLDILLVQKAWRLTCIFFAAALGPAVTRWVIRILLKIAAPALEEIVRNAYDKARAISDQGGRSNGDIKVATDWKKRRSKRLKRMMRISSFAASMTMITIFATSATGSGIDACVGVAFLTAFSYFAWTSFQLFINAHLAEQILVDAALGLTKSKLTGWEHSD